eukprot:4933122-Alexandrium_andersonii.AAC.1
MTVAAPLAAAPGTSALGQSRPAPGWTAADRTSAGAMSTQLRGPPSRSTGLPGPTQPRRRRGWG